MLPGEPITLYVSTTARSFRVSAFRMGWYRGDEARLLWKSAPVKGHRQRQPELIRPTNTVEARWGPSLTVPTHGWPEGSYLLRLDADHGAQRFVPVTVRSASTAGKTVIKNGVETWQAYNTWGGYDLYNGPGGTGDYANRSLAVSLDRPYDANGAYMFLYHERKTIELAERSGLPLAYLTSMDIDGDPHLLDGAHALFTAGHDEYWTPQERAHVTAARNAGMNIAFMGANTMFRRTRMASTRLGERRLVICYKTSYLQDPMYGKDNALVTSDWREPPHPDPESSLTGTLYESNPVTADYVVASPGSWIFAHTGVSKGTRFTGLVGIEYDRVNPVYPVRAADAGALPLTADLPRRAQLLRLGLLHPPRRGGGVQHRHHALGGVQQRAAPVRAEQARGPVHPPGHHQPAARVRRRPGRGGIPGARQPRLDARMARRSDRRPPQPVAARRALNGYGRVRRGLGAGPAAGCAGAGSPRPGRRRVWR